MADKLSNSLSDAITNLDTEDFLAEFTGTVATSMNLNYNAGNYRLLIFAVYNTANDLIASATITPYYARNVPIKLFGDSSSQWGSVTLANDYASATFNRTSATTAKVRLIGILKKS